MPFAYTELSLLVLIKEHISEASWVYQLEQCMQIIISSEDKAMEHSGPLDVEALKAWVLKHIPSHVTRVSTRADLDSFLWACDPQHSKKAKGISAGWNTCVLLVSDRRDISPLYASLSTQYHGKARSLSSTHLGLFSQAIIYS
jgi:hypothetical protein